MSSVAGHPGKKSVFRSNCVLASAFAAALSILVGDENAIAADGDVCTTSLISFTPLEPEEPSWWKQPTSTLLEDGREIATVTLEYNSFDEDFAVNFREFNVMKINDLVFKYRDMNVIVGGIDWWASLPAYGWMIPHRETDQHRIALLAMSAHQYHSVHATFDYPDRRSDDQVFVDLFCFMTSPTIAGGIR